MSCRRGGGAVPFVRARSCAGRAGPVRRRPWCLGGLVRCCSGLGGRGKPSHSPWIRAVGGLQRVRWVRRRGWQVVRVQWWLSGGFRIRVGLWGLASLGLGVVAGRIWFLVGSRRRFWWFLGAGWLGSWRWGCRRRFGRGNVAWLPPWWPIVFRVGWLGMRWAWGPGGGGVSVVAAVVSFVTAGAVCGGIGGVGVSGGGVVGSGVVLAGAVVGVGAPFPVGGQAWVFGPASRWRRTSSRMCGGTGAGWRG